MKTETKGKRNGIQWKILTQLDYLDFADDLALMSHSLRQMRDKTTDPRPDFSKSRAENQQKENQDPET